MSWAVAALAFGLALCAGWELRRLRDAVARAVHETRGPLAAAQLGLHLGPAAGLERRRAQAVELEVSRAALALQDLERAARRSGRGAEPALRALDLRELASDAVEAWRPMAARDGRCLALSGGVAPLMVRGRRARLAQAIGNLLANSLEHGAGDICVRCRVAGEWVRVEVADEGPGLPAPVDRLAQRRPRRGRGRGLKVASEVARAHGGRLGAAPAPQGARLVLELPAARAATTAGAQQGPGA